LSLEYDAENNRIAVTEKGIRTEYVINNNTKYSQMLESETAGKKVSYIYGNGLVAHDDGEYYTYHFDVRGSTTAITDENGKVTDRMYYAPYGELLYREGETKTPFLYCGLVGVQTDENGLYYMRARYYNPEIKRFINQDVLRGSITDSTSLNRYSYVNGNPISYIDPFGLSKEVAKQSSGESNWGLDGETLSRVADILHKVAVTVG